MNSSLYRFLHANRRHIVIASTSSAAAIGFTSSSRNSSDPLPIESASSHAIFGVSSCACESAQHPSSLLQKDQSPSLWRRLLKPFGILYLPRPMTPNDPAFKLSKRFLRKRQSDETKMRKLLSEDVPKLTGDPDFETKIAVLRDEIFQLAYGKGVTAQMREDFLIRYGCTGFNDVVLNRLVELCATRGVVEVGAGHGQWQKALTDAYNSVHNNTGKRKQFDFVLAYDNNSNLPLNTHIYNQYTRPHHDYFGTVQRVDSPEDLGKVLRSWACRGRALLMVYPPPGPMAIDTITTYTSASPDNDTLIYVGEGRGGANGDDAFFDFLETGGWMLIDILEVVRPPGDKGCEKLYILQKIRAEP